MTTSWFEHRAVLAAPDENVGQAIGLLLLRAPDWLHRKVDALEFRGDVSFRRQVSIDFQIVAKSEPFDRICPGRVLIPLAILEKQLLFGFDVIDESGASMSILTTDENVWVAWSVLVAMAQSALDDGEPPLIDGELEALKAVAGASHDTAQQALGALANHNRLNELQKHPLLYAGLSLFAHNFLLLAVIDPERSPRRLVKISWEIDIADQMERFEFEQRLGLQSADLHVDVPRIDSRSYHVEAPAPMGLQMAADPAVTADLDGDPHDLNHSVGHSAATAHAHLVPDVYQLHRAHRADVSFWLFPAEHGLVRLSLALGVIVTTLLLAALLDPASIIRARAAPGTAVTLLLAVVGVLTIFIVRPGEHHFVSYLLVPYRVAVASIGALIPLIAAATLFSGSFSDETVVWLWFGLLIISEICLALIAFVYLRARKLWRHGE